jgi:hypothetical protein
VPEHCGQHGRHGPCGAGEQRNGPHERHQRDRIDLAARRDHQTEDAEGQRSAGSGEPEQQREYGMTGSHGGIPSAQDADDASVAEVR